MSKHGMAKHRIYSIWKAMVYRTRTKGSQSYKDYGARGITVCSEWDDVCVFISDMYPSYSEGLTLDRIDNDKGYCKDNCRWTTMLIQQRNTRRIRSNNTSGYRGVFVKKGKFIVAQIRVENKSIHTGTFNTKTDAAKAYNKYVIDNDTEHTLNIIKEKP